MYKYEQLKRFHHGHQLQIYMYALMYADPEKMPVDGNFPATKYFFANCKKLSTPGTIPKHWLGFSYIHSEDYDLDKNFDETYHTSNDKVLFFAKLLWSLRKNGLMI